jgi:hypothetical protein
MIWLLCFVMAALTSPFKSKIRLETENAVLRHQLIVLRRKLRGRVKPANCSDATSSWLIESHTRAIGLERFAPPLLIAGRIDLDRADLSTASPLYLGISPNEADRIEATSALASFSISLRWRGRLRRNRTCRFIGGLATALAARLVSVRVNPRGHRG